jgi:hypothetical protein
MRQKLSLFVLSSALMNTNKDNFCPITLIVLNEKHFSTKHMIGAQMIRPKVQMIRSI